MSTAPIFAPNGQLGDIPSDSLAAAIRAGAKPGVNIISPNGKPGVVPADRYVDAVKGGAKVAPFEDQDVKHPGFWAALHDDVSGMLQGAGKIAEAATNPGPPIGLATDVAQGLANIPAEDADRKQAGYSMAYRALAPVAQNVLGVNVPGMEQSAKEGDIGGVAGHAAAVPVAMAATEGLVRGLPKVVAPIAEVSGPAARAVAKKLPEVAGGAAGAYVGHATGIPEGGLIGAIAGRQLVKSLWDNFSDVYSSWHDRNVPYAGETEPPASAEPAPSSGPSKELPPAFSSAGPQYKEPVGTAGNPLAIDIAAYKQAESELGPQAPLAEKMDRAREITANPAQIEKALNDALGGKPLQQNVPLRSQLQSTAPKAPAIPEGFTPADSSVLKAYKYDPGSQEFTAITNNGQTYTHGEVSPDQFKAFEDADSKGRAWTSEIRNNSPLVRKNGSPVKPATMGAQNGETIPKAAAGMDDLTGILQKSLEAVTQKSP